MTRIFLLALVAAVFCRAQVTYRVQLSSTQGGAIVELPAEKYVAAVLAGESSRFQSEEALKAMAVAARTYAAHLRGRHVEEGFDFCATTHCQHLDLQGSTKSELVRAAEATSGELLWFDGEPALTVYSRDCGGQTENVHEVWPDVHAPYLAARSDPFCTRHGPASWSWTALPEEIAAALRGSQLTVPERLERVVIGRTSESGRARMLQLIGPDRQIAISASSFRFAIGRKLGWNTLRSNRYEVESVAEKIYFRGTGEGHAVGLCQHGADEMGLEGHTYGEILAFYYPGTVAGRTAAGLKWAQMAGEGVTLFSLHPDQDRKILTTAEELNREIAVRFGETAPAITVRVYPDVARFRNATGEPGWVAARTSGSTIELQSLATLEARGILRQTLRHELLHVAVEHQATPDLPVWFREGLVEYLSGTDQNVASPPPSINDADLRQRRDRTRAETAYGNARARVNQLINRYGEAVVFTWLNRGLPAEVTHSSTSNAATNNR